MISGLIKLNCKWAKCPGTAAIYRSKKVKTGTRYSLKPARLYLLDVQNTWKFVKNLKKATYRENLPCIFPKSS